MIGSSGIWLSFSKNMERGSVFGSVFFYLLSLRLWRDLYGGEVIIFLPVGTRGVSTEGRCVSSEALLVYSVCV